MATPSRRQNTPLENLLISPEDFDFFQAVRLLNRAHHHRLASSSTSEKIEFIKFNLKSDNKFPVGMIEKIKEEDNCHHITTSFGGLTGAMGILPQHYTELLIKTTAQGNTALGDFFNIFNHKIISLLYRAWEKQHFVTVYERKKDISENPDELTQGLFSLSGIGIDNLQRQQSVNDEYCAYYAGILSHQIRSATALELILSDHFQLSIKIIQLQGQWLYLNKSDFSRLSTKALPKSYQQLGKNFVIGQRCWSVQNKFRVYLGPVDYKSFLELLPNNKLLRQLIDITRFYCGVEFDFDIQIELLANEVPSLSLGKLMPAYLGWNTWLKNKPLKQNANDVIIHTHTIRN